MNLDQKSIKYIKDVIKTAQLVDIDNIIIEPGIVRAIDEARTVVILQTEDVPDMPFNSIGFNRIPIYQSRYDVVSNQPNFKIEVLVDDNNTFARALVMKAKGIKIDYRCANPSTIQAPRKISDTDVAQVQLNEEAVNMLHQGMLAMNTKQVTLLSTKDGVSFEFVDINNDVFNHNFASSATSLGADNDSIFVHKYPVKPLLALFKQNTTNTFTIGKAGTLNIVINGFRVTVLPQV